MLTKKSLLGSLTIVLEMSGMNINTVAIANSNFSCICIVLEPAHGQLRGLSALTSKTTSDVSRQLLGLQLYFSWQ